jgi:hypothetical protein
VGWSGGNFSPIREYSSTVKNRQKRASVHRRVGVKGLRKSYFIKKVEVLKAMRGDFQFFSKANLETRIKEGSVGMLQRKLD